MYLYFHARKADKHGSINMDEAVIRTYGTLTNIRNGNLVYPHATLKHFTFKLQRNLLI